MLTFGGICSMYDGLAGGAHHTGMLSCCSVFKNANLNCLVAEAAGNC